MMMMLLRSLHTQAALRGDGLLAEFQGSQNRIHELPKATNDNQPPEVPQQGPEFKSQSF
ncbi:hypothetical protein G5V57_23165 [Nordella sp. HKS 07]|uniref:hypothetical protein n=1 Tax=Nordella sp. HKS 07 TaxID=2712222 RepID=UPI0013E1FCB9|nr:hypothetical protein [Nordella sp. HKS 07]QIG50372.1 hypothetical protein G5V57_23165 [Nordella sp. HKS 07]